MNTLILLMIVGLLLGFLFDVRSAQTDVERIEVVVPRRRSRPSGCAVMLFVIATAIVSIAVFGG